MKVKKRLEESDFLNHSAFADTLTATYLGNSRYLTYGEEYRVVKSNRKNKVTVPLSLNKKLGMSNGGVEFSINQFEIEVEVKEESKVLSLRDLSTEDRESLLREARELVEKENLERDAKVMYSIKKRQLITDTVEEISRALHLKHEPERRKLRDRLVLMISFIYKSCVQRNLSSSTNISITNEGEWENYVRITDNVKIMMIGCSTGQKVEVKP